MTIDTTAPADTAEKSLREELQEAYDASQAVDETAVDAGTVGGVEARSRDGRGRFAGKTEAVDATIVDATQRAPAEGTTGTAANQGAPANQSTPADQSGQGQPVVIPPPTNLKPELRGAWEAAPPELRKYIADREAEVHKGFTRMDEERQFGKTMRETISPYAAMIQAEGGDPASAVKALLNTAYILRAGSVQQKVTALQAVAQQYGIPLDHVQQLQQQQRIDPHVAALQEQVQQLTQSQQRAAQEREQMESHQTLTAIQAFAASPGHEHFEQVKPLMATLLANEQAKDLQDAYDMAVWARPDLRQTVLAAQQQTAEQARVTQAQARAAAAKQAAASVSGAPGVSIPVGAPDRSLRDELRANLRAAQH